MAAPLSLTPALLLAAACLTAVALARLAQVLAAALLLASRRRPLAPLPPDLPDEALLDLMALG